MSLFAIRRRGIPRDVGIWCGWFSILSILKAGMCAGCPPPWRFVHAIKSAADQPTSRPTFESCRKTNGSLQKKERFVDAAEAAPMNRWGSVQDDYSLAVHALFCQLSTGLLQTDDVKYTQCENENS